MGATGQGIEGEKTMGFDALHFDGFRLHRGAHLGGDYALALSGLRLGNNCLVLLRGLRDVI